MDATKTGTSGSVETEYTDSRFVRLTYWFVLKLDSLILSPQAPGTVKMCLEGQSGEKEFFEIIVLDSALAVTPGSTIRLQLPSKKPIKLIEVEHKNIVSAKVDPGDPTRAELKGLVQGFSTIQLSYGTGEPEVFEVVVHPEKITENKVLILSAGRDYWLRMSSRKEITQVENSDDKVLEVRSVQNRPESISLMTLKPGFTRLKLTAKDNSKESFAVFVEEEKK